MRTLIALSFSLFLWASPGHAVDDKKLVDLTYPFSEAAQHWPAAKPFHLEKISIDTPSIDHGPSKDSPSIRFSAPPTCRFSRTLPSWIVCPPKVRRFSRCR